MSYRSPLPRYDDMQVMAATASHPLASSLTQEEYRDTALTLTFMSHDADDVLTTIMQMAHAKALGSNLGDLHMHVVPMAAGAGDVYFEVSYSWQNVGGTFPATASWTTSNVTASFVAGDQYDHKTITLLSDIAPPASEGYSSILLCTITRLGTNTLDTYTTNKDHGTGAANLGILSIDGHIPIDRVGSVNTFSD